MSRVLMSIDEQISKTHSVFQIEIAKNDGDPKMNWVSFGNLLFNCVHFVLFCVWLLCLSRMKSWRRHCYMLPAGKWAAAIVPVPDRIILII